MEIHRSNSFQNAAMGYLEFLRKPSMSVGVYRLTAGSSDAQTPHSEDELYYVLSGRSRFLAGDEEAQVQAGDLIYVAAGEVHRFHDIQEDLEILVVFSPPEGSRTPSNGGRA